MDAEKTGKLIRELRTEKGLTQQELASRLKVSPTAVSKWENGKNLPDISLLEAIAEALNVSCSEIIMGRRTPQPVQGENAGGANEIGESAIRSVIDESVAQRKRNTRKTIVTAMIILALLAAILPYYLRDEPVRDLSAGYYVGVKLYHTIDYLTNERSADELVDISFNVNDIKQQLSAFGADAVGSVRVEKIWLVMSSPDSSLKFRSEDDILKDETGAHFGFYQGTVDHIEKTKNGQYDFHLITAAEYGGVPDEETAVEILADVWILISYRKDFPWSRRYSVMLRASGTDTLPVKPQP